MDYLLFKIFISFYCYNNKILLYNKDINKKNDEIGYINEKNIFIPEFVLYYKEKISISTIKSFIINKLNKNKE